MARSNNCESQLEYAGNLNALSMTILSGAACIHSFAISRVKQSTTIAQQLTTILKE